MINFYGDNISQSLINFVIDKKNNSLFHEATLEQLADSSKLTKETASKLMQLNNKTILRHLAANYYTPKNIFRQLSQNEDADIRKTIAQNWAVPLDILKNLLENDKDESVRNAVKKNEFYKYLVWSSSMNKQYIQQYFKL